MRQVYKEIHNNNNDFYLFKTPIFVIIVSG